ncbi:MAG: hypothetical protein KIT14_05305 [bacterium]|nr:hypothetical protein [bacterium]
MRTLVPSMVALPDFGVAAVFLITWIDPTFFGEKMVTSLVMVMLLEFLVVHSAGFMGAIVHGDGKRSTRILMLLGLTLVYGLFAAGFAVGMGSWWPVQAMVLLTLNRMTPLLMGPAPDASAIDPVMASWAASVVFYLFSVLVGVTADVPPLGITPEVIAAQGMTTGGEWPEYPYKPIASGTIYFTLQGIWELLLGWWASRGVAAGAAARPGRRWR